MRDNDFNWRSVRPKITRFVNSLAHQVGGARVPHFVQLQEGGAYHQRLHVVVVDADAAVVRKVHQRLQRPGKTQQWDGREKLKIWDREKLLGVDALDGYVLLLALGHIVGEHGVEVRNRRRQNDPVRSETLLVNLKIQNFINLAKLVLILIKFQISFQE